MCRVSGVCGGAVLTEEAYCYRAGSQCEAWYSQGGSRQVPGMAAGGGRGDNQVRTV